jgi:glycosyltransferase involved in cell wall biosynthesis
MTTPHKDLMITGLPETGMKAMIDYLVINGMPVSYFKKSTNYSTESTLQPVKKQQETEAVLTDKNQLIMNSDPRVEVKNGNHVYLYCDVWDYVIYAVRYHGKSTETAISEWVEYNKEAMAKVEKGAILLSSYAFMQQPSRALSILNDQFGYSFDVENARALYQDFYKAVYFHDGYTVDLIRSCKQHPDVLPLIKQLHKAAIWPHDTIAEGAQPKKVDVIIPCYNLGHLLGDTLASIERSFNHNFNVIIIDDGSTKQDSIEGVKRAEQDGYRVIWQQNTGLCKALNNAVKEGSAEYLLILSADDMIDPKLITEGTRILDSREEVGVVYANPKTYEAWYSMWLTPDFDPVRFLSLNFIVATSVFRRKYWEQAGGYDPMADGNEDWEMWMSSMEQGAQFYHVDEYLIQYRFRPDSKIQTCNLPENRKRLVEYMSGKHKELYKQYVPGIVGTLHYTISDIEMRNRPSSAVPQQYKSIDQAEVEQGAKALGKLGEFMYRFLRKSGHLSLKKQK